MFFSRIKRKVMLVLAAFAVTLSGTINPVLAADNSTETAVAPTISTFRFADIDLQVDVTDELVCFTRNVTSNNAYLERIGAENAEGLRNSMIASHIYLEGILKDADAVNYEFIIVGDRLQNTSVSDLSTLSDSELDKLLSDYTKNINKKNDKIEETLNTASIEKVNDAVYFYTDVTAITENNKTVLLRKYYTIKNGYYYTFSLQTSDKTVNNHMQEILDDIVKSAQYKEIKEGIFNNPIFSEVFSVAVTSLAPVAILGLILFVSIKMTSKKKK